MRSIAKEHDIVLMPTLVICVDRDTPFIIQLLTVENLLLHGNSLVPLLVTISGKNEGTLLDY